jgi:hypothetical protein
MLFYSGCGLERVYTGCFFIQGLSKEGLYRILFYSGFGLDRFIQDAVLFRVWFRQVFTGNKTASCINLL